MLLVLFQKKKKENLLFSVNVVIGQSSCKCPGLSVCTVSPFTILYTINIISYQFQMCSKVVTIYTDHSGENHVHKHKTIKFDLMGERPAKILPKSAQRTKKSRKTASPQIKTHVF